MISNIIFRTRLSQSNKKKLELNSLNYRYNYTLLYSLCFFLRKKKWSTWLNTIRSESDIMSINDISVAAIKCATVAECNKAYIFVFYSYWMLLIFQVENEAPMNIPRTDLPPSKNITSVSFSLKPVDIQQSTKKSQPDTLWFTCKWLCLTRDRLSEIQTHDLTENYD